MELNKLNVNGIPLIEHCRDNDISIKTIYSICLRYRNNPEYKYASDADIAVLALNEYEDKLKYNYDGMPLRDYCKVKKYPYNHAIAILKRLKEKYPFLTYNELTRIVVEYYINMAIDLKVGDKSLYEFCKENNLGYCTVKDYIYKELEKDPTASIEDIVKKYMSKRHLGNYKYFYNEMPLKEYCLREGYYYNSILRNITIELKKEENKDRPLDDVVKEYMDNYKPLEKMMYKGQTLYKYCKDNNINYNSVKSFIHNNKNKYPDLSIDELIKKAIESVSMGIILYYYNGEPLVDVCKKHNIKINSIRSSIRRKMEKELHKDIQQVVDECVESYLEYVKYTYNGVPVVDICRLLNINYRDVISIYEKDYSKRKDISPDAAFKEILLGFIKEYKERNNNTNKKDNIKKIFDSIKNNEIDINRAKKISDIFKMDFENIIDINHKGVSYNNAIMIIWYFADTRSKKGASVSAYSLNVLLDFIKVLKKCPEEADVTLFNLIRIHKCRLFDCKSMIIEKEGIYIDSIIDEYTTSLGIKYTEEEYKYFYKLISSYIMNAIDENYSNSCDYIMNYIDKYVRHYFERYLKKYKLNNGEKAPLTLKSKDDK